MPKKPLQRRKGDTFLHGCNGKGVPQHTRGHSAVDAGSVGKAFNPTLTPARYMKG